MPGVKVAALWNVIGKHYLLRRRHPSNTWGRWKHKPRGHLSEEHTRQNKQQEPWPWLLVCSKWSTDTSVAGPRVHDGRVAGDEATMAIWSQIMWGHLGKSSNLGIFSKKRKPVKSFEQRSSWVDLLFNNITLPSINRVRGRRRERHQ